MEKRFLIPDNPHVLLEIKRLINAITTDNTERFDVFENDVFLFNDPMDAEEATQPEDEQPDEPEIFDDDLSDLPPPSKSDLQELIEGGISEGHDDDDFVDDDGCGDGCGDHDDDNPFNLFMSAESSGVGRGKPSPPTMHLLTDFFDHEDEGDDANFIHKPSNLKLQWRTTDGNLYSNQPLKFRKLSNIVNQCIISMGRRTKPFLVRYFYFGEDGNEHT